MQKSFNRLAIFVFYDKDGVVDDYKIYFLNELQKVSNEIFIVVNGSINSHGRSRLEDFGKVIIRENVGFDISGYKFGIESVGNKELAKYDELVLCNDTCFGPFYNFSTIFDKMNGNQDLEIWGITKGYPFTAVIDGKTVNIQDHIHSYFLVIRNRLLRDERFYKYWDMLPKINTYYDAVNRFECVFTEHFSKLGYKHGTYIDMDKYKDYTPDPLSLMTTRLLQEGLPIMKRRDFYSKIEPTVNWTVGNEIRDSYNWIVEKTDYDVDMIWQTVLRNGDIYNIWKQMCLTRILPANAAVSKASSKNLHIAIFAHIYRMEMAEFMLEKINYTPPSADVYITTNTVEKQARLQKLFSSTKFNKVTVLVSQNRGRGESALLIEAKKYFFNYDIACVIHDKDSPYLGNSSYTTSYGFSYKIYENMVKSTEYVENIINLFAKSERLGVLMPPEPNHSFYDSAFAHLWTVPDNLPNTQKLLDELGCNVRLDKNNHPIYPAGGMFWCRPKALEKLFIKNWKYNDFPAEPIELDGTILHAIERSYCYVAQDAGFYSAFVMNDQFAELEYGNLKYHLQDVYSKIRQEFFNRGWVLTATLNNELDKLIVSNEGAYRIQNKVLRVARIAKRFMRSPISTGKFVIKRILRRL